ncbi:hypothetical protein CEP54_002907 [Fusarium duplospermum]|uniref:F-box domain-containing protein n=1 Tax=Fusarium duplospermum TaxID=1325734 RepID=A0A428QT00_9HYPO|nr:hypothetical protein CEP54_002907 [Fusarium duplospermum]
MTQCLLSIQNGSLRLEIPEREHQTQDPSAREWMKSHLDDICLTSFQQSSQLQPHHRSHGNFERIPKKLRAQNRLVNQDGVIVITNPRTWYNQLTGKRVTVDVQPQDQDFRSPFFKLPIELRLCIYRYLLITEGLGVLCPDPNGFRILPREYYDGVFQIHPQILATCRQINQEGSSVLYSENGFRREFLWRRIWTGSGRKPFPRWDSSPLKDANLHYISRIRIFRSYDGWFRNGNLKVLYDFPNLRELQVHIDENDIWGDLNPDGHWKDSMRAINRDRPDLPCIKTQVRLAFDRRYRAWCDRCTRKPLDFSLHRIKKDELEKWIRSEGLFSGRELVWSFTTQTSEYCGPSCIVALAVGDSRGKGDTIECRIKSESGTEYSIEPASDDEEV